MNSIGFAYAQNKMSCKYPISIVLMSLFALSAYAQPVKDTTFYDKQKRHIGTIVTTENDNRQIINEYDEKGLLTEIKTLTTTKKKKGGHSFKETSTLIDPQGCVRLEINQSSNSSWGIVKYYTYHKNGVIKDIEKYICLLTDTLMVQDAALLGNMTKGFDHGVLVKQDYSSDLYDRPRGIECGIWYEFDENGKMVSCKKYPKRMLNENSLDKSIK